MQLTATTQETDMILVIKNGTPQAEIDAILDEIAALGLEPLHMPGTEKVVLGALGDERALASLRLDARPCIERVVPILSPYKLVARESRTEPSRVTVGDHAGAQLVTLGPETFTVIAGPCSVESEEQILATARAARAAGATALRGGAFKPRTSPYGFQGLGDRGLELLALAREATGLPVVTECLSPAQVERVAAKADVIQIGARNMQNFELLREVGRTDRPVLLKRGMAATLDELLHAAEYIAIAGNERIILCERGIRTFGTVTRNTLDLSAVCALRERTHLPVIVDPSHATGVRHYVPPMSRAALATGADGIIIECHPEPEAALSDGKQSLTLDELDTLMRELRALAPILRRVMAPTAAPAPVNAGKSTLAEARILTPTR